MKEERPSRTAEGAAILRALHQTLDAEPKILNDPIAVRLVDPSSDFYKAYVQGLEEMPAALRLRRRGHAVMRSRYTEDCLADSLAHGVRQYVIMGAGLDTFGYRQPSWATSLRIFEVDHPATQRWKRARLSATGIQIPKNVIFAPVNFEEVSLEEGLAASGLDLGVPTFFSWLGVASYLTEAAIDRTLKFVLAMPRSSEIVLDFIVPNELIAPEEAPVAATVLGRFAQQGEPIVTRFAPEELTAKLKAAGFSNVAHLSPQAAFDRYFVGRQDGLGAPTAILLQLMRAIV
jgi:methyltransferase (TIGR00027 family)